jgi:hypothetical protein
MGETKLRWPTRGSLRVVDFSRLDPRRRVAPDHLLPARPPSPAMHPTFAAMAKKPGDSTRFTPTGVWTHTKPGNRSTVLQFADPAPPNETPQQKVKRLREAANRMKMAQITGWDVAYFWGRVAADYAHRTAVYTIVFATGAASRFILSIASGKTCSE